MDGDSYTEVYANTAQDSATPQYFDLPGTIARYAKLHCVDNHGDHFYLRVNEFELHGHVYQNDAGSGSDAGDNFNQATSISLGSHSGYTYESRDPCDWYKFNMTFGEFIEVTMTPPTGSDHDLYLYDPLGNMTANSTSYGDATEHIVYETNSTGEWRILIHASEGKGEYSFTVTYADTIHVESIDFKKTNPKLDVKVTIYDDVGGSVPGATVYMNITYPDESVHSVSEVTNEDGIAKYTITPLEQGTYIVIVTNIEKDGWIYDPAANVETSDSYTV